MSKQPELTPTSEKIDKLIKRIDTGDIRIPAFQRSYVWKQNQVLDLLDSIVANYPIGSVLLWYTKERLKYTRNIAGYKIPDSAIEYPLNYVLDGQQRLSSIYAVFSDKTEQDQSSDQYNPNLNLFEIYYDFDAKAFRPKAEINTESGNVIFLKDLIDTTKLIPALGRLNSKYHSAASDLCSKFINYEIPVVTIKYRTKQEVGIIFERINNTGTRLSTLDLMTAWTWTDDFHLVESANDLIDELEEKGFGKIPYNILLQSVSGVIKNDTTTEAILQLSGEEVRDNWDLFRKAIKKAIDFLSTDLKCIHSDFLPSIQQLVGITKFYSIPSEIHSNHLKALRQWFWKTAFSNRYSTGQTRSKMNADIHAISAFRNGQYDLLSTYSYTVTRAELSETTFSKSNSVTRAFLLLMAQSNPLDLVKNSAIDLGQALSEYNRKEYHHVFPQAFLKGRHFPTEKINSTLNFCFLPADSNKRISRKEPRDYFFSLVPESNFNDILESNVLPLEKSIYQNNEFDKFLEKRADAVISAIDRLTT